MSEDGFKKYIESRTVADIMEDYSEQRDEWELLFKIKDGNVVQFRHRNGKTFFCEQYCPKDGEYVINPEIEKLLSGQSVENQMKYYYISKMKGSHETVCADIANEDLKKQSVNLSEYAGVVKLLLKGDILVGAIVKGHLGNSNLLLESPVRICSADGNEGDGHNEHEDYAYLIFDV